ncbi:hypothetical protein PInf_010856 [Phytophthora infestans]|nr:hypothetical protein PInf_010856 [Phytophthora infestans]
MSATTEVNGTRTAVLTTSGTDETSAMVTAATPKEEETSVTSVATLATDENNARKGRVATVRTVVAHMKDDEETRDTERAQTYLTTVRPEMALDRFVRVLEVSKDEKTQKSASERRWSGEGERRRPGEGVDASEIAWVMTVPVVSDDEGDDVTRERRARRKARKAAKRLQVK